MSINLPLDTIGDMLMSDTSALGFDSLASVLDFPVRVSATVR